MSKILVGGGFAIIVAIAWIFYPAKINKPIDVTEYKQLYCLAKNVYFEAASESFDGKVAVAIVTMNRVKHEDFPDNICSVVYERNKRTCQFSWTCEKKRIKINDKKFVESIEASRLVMQEKVTIDKIENALYYHADYVNPQWKLKRVAKIGRHIFYEPRNKQHDPSYKKI